MFLIKFVEHNSSSYLFLACQVHESSNPSRDRGHRQRPGHNTVSSSNGSSRGCWNGDSCCGSWDGNNCDSWSGDSSSSNSWNGGGSSEGKIGRACHLRVAATPFASRTEIGTVRVAGHVARLRLRARDVVVANVGDACAQEGVDAGAGNTRRARNEQEPVLLLLSGINQLIVVFCLLLIGGNLSAHHQQGAGQ